MKPDPWQEAHDELEAAESFIPKGPDYNKFLEEPLTEFVRTCEELTEKYRPFSKGAKGTQPELGFYAESEAHADVAHSMATMTCNVCTSREGVAIRRDPRTNKPAIFCLNCWKDFST